MSEMHRVHLPALPAHTVHVWVANLDPSAALLTSLSRTLSPEEQKRAARFYFERDRRHFIVARGILRQILSRYLRLAPDQLKFCYGLNGKPRLDQASDTVDLRFNLSHSHGVALYGITLGRDLGVDIEYVRVLSNTDQIMERFFSPLERAMMQAVHPDLRTEMFFTCWTLKEAYLKAVGEGLTTALDSIEISAAPGESARLLSVKGSPSEVGRWQLEALSTPQGFVAAIVVEGHDWELSYHEWPPLDEF